MAESITDKTRPDIRWDDVIGLEDLKATMEEAVIGPLKAPNGDAERLPLKWRGILFYGVPGSGKTYLARAVGARVNHFYSIHGCDVTSRWIKASAVEVLRGVFEEAIRDQPSLLLIDDIDYLRAADTTAQAALNTDFSNLMKDIAARGDKVVVLGATSKPWDLADDILGSFERLLYFPLPKQAARVDLIKLYLGSVRTTVTSADLQSLGPATTGLSAADLSIFVRDALMEPVRKVQRATHYKKVANTRSEVKAELLTPCDPDEQGAIKMDWTELAIDTLLEPPITMLDMQMCLQSVRPSIDEDELVQLQTFTMPAKASS